MEQNRDELICIDDQSGADKSNFLFQKTKTYTLNTRQCITIPVGCNAEVFVRLYGKQKLKHRTGKKLYKSITGGKDLLDRDFHVIFSAQTKKLPKKTWGVGKLTVKCGAHQYQVGANGSFDISIEDHVSYINSFGEASVGVFTVDRVTEHVIGCIRDYASQIIVKLFEEVGTLIVSADFLLDELNLRFEEFFTQGELDELPGIRITHINVVSLLIREEDIQNARKLHAATVKPIKRTRTAAPGSKPAPRTVRKPPLSAGAKRPITPTAQPTPKAASATSPQGTPSPIETSKITE